MAAKAQLSLETTIQIVIVAVVVVAVVSLLLTTYPSDTSDISDEQLPLSKITNTCEQYCVDWKFASETNKPQQALDYCIQRFTSDRDGNGEVTDTAGAGYNSYCEDGIHCFNVHTCARSGTTLDINTCVDIMCDYYQENEGMSAEDAGTNLTAVFAIPKATGNRGSGTCFLNETTDSAGNAVNTWWNETFSENAGNPCL